MVQLQRFSELGTVILGLLLLTLWSCAPCFAQAPPSANPTQDPQAPVVPPPPTEAEQKIDEAIEKLAQIQTAQADLAQSTFMLGENFTLTGRYAKAPGYRFFFRLTLEGLGKSNGSFLQVADGTNLYQITRVLNGNSGTRYELPKILELLENPLLEQELPQFRVREQYLDRLGFVGPDALLKGLRQQMRFADLEEQVEDEQAFWRIRGTWLPEVANELRGPNRQRVLSLRGLPAYVPSQATLLIDQKTGWPTQLEMLGQVPSQLSVDRDNRLRGPDGRPVGPRTEPERIEPTRIRLVYSNVEINGEIADQTFQYTPPSDLQVVNQTDAIVLEIERSIQFATQQSQVNQSQPPAPSAESGPGSNPLDLPK